MQRSGVFQRAQRVAAGLSRQSVRFEVLPTTGRRFRSIGTASLIFALATRSQDQTRADVPERGCLGDLVCCGPAVGVRAPLDIRGRRFTVRSMMERSRERKPTICPFSRRLMIGPTRELLEGWESDEATARRQQIEERKRLLAQVEEQFGSDPDFLRRQIERLYAGWPDNPKRRARKWAGWWE